MVSSSLLTFISNTFSRIHNNVFPFGGINVLLVGDLAQLPPVNGSPVYKSSVWQIFFPLFLRTCHRQQNDMAFYNLLEEIRFGNISEASWNMLEQKHIEYAPISHTPDCPDSTHTVSYRQSTEQSNTTTCNHLTDVNATTLHESTDFLDEEQQECAPDCFDTTHIVGYRQSAEQLNTTICNLLPVDNENEIILHKSTDFLGEEQWESTRIQTTFKHYTNLPSFVRLQAGARVMYLKNNMMQHNLCNGTVGIDIDLFHPTPWTATTIFQENDDIDVFGAVTGLNNNTLSLQIYKLYVINSTKKSLPTSATWLRALGTIITIPHSNNNTTVFEVSATQYVNSTGSQFKQTIIVYHQSHRQYLQARTSKARVGAKVTICGELDIMDDKLYMELHVFEYESLTNTESITNTSPAAISPSKRTRLSQLTKEVVDTPPTPNSANQETDENITQHPPNHNMNENQPSEHETNINQPAKTVTELSTNTLQVPKYTKRNLRKKDTN
ncbi:401_t:CDS:2 [Paraglomus occultum]|uniref:401_t:CDS:1 n=1 Tax=Paraglomus occultum TaxID=144539 RepID=A0A9N9D5L2_9GLOM|nr:401_t:CDS:2 [Paraglomus occultum]